MKNKLDRNNFLETMLKEVDIKNNEGVVVIHSHKNDVDSLSSSCYNRHILTHDSVFSSLSSLVNDKGEKT